MNKYFIGMLSLLVVASLMLVGCGAGTGQAVARSGGDFCSKVKACAATTSVAVGSTPIADAINAADIAFQQASDSQDMISATLNVGLAIDSAALAKQVCPGYLNVEKAYCIGWSNNINSTKQKIADLGNAITAVDVVEGDTSVYVAKKALLEKNIKPIEAKYTATCEDDNKAVILSVCNNDGASYKLIKADCVSNTAKLIAEPKCACQKGKYKPIALGGVCK